MIPDAPRTVLILTPSSRLLGARRSLLALAETLDPDRWRPVVCGQSFGQLGEALHERDIPMHVLKMGWWRKAKYWLWRPFVIARLAALARRVGADLIHCNEPYPNPFAVRAANGAIPVLTHVRLGIRPGMIRKYDLARADRIAVCSRSLVEDFAEWPDRADRLAVVHNGVNLDEFERTRSPEAARAQLGLPPQARLFVAIGQVGPRKGGDLILAAFARALKRHPEAMLAFVGNPHRGQETFADELMQRASHLPLMGRVLFFPFTDHILPWYEAADVNLLISRDEGFGRTIIEAGALGVPSIGADVGGIPEIVVDGSTGRLVPPENVVALEEAMENLIVDTSQRHAMGEAAFRRTRQHFSIQAHTDRMMDLYDEIVEEGERA